MNLEARYADGQLAALVRLKLAFPAATNPTVQGSATLQSRETKPMPPAAQEQMQAPTTPYALSQLFDVHEQGKTRTEPHRKLSGEMCTTCRKEKHYGPCSAPRKIPSKEADFNPGLTADDPTQSDNPATSAHYHAATTADSSMARARDGRPADEQAGTAFADLFRHLGISNSADEPGRMTGGLNKVAGTFPQCLKRGGWQLWGTDGHSTHEQRGPSVNPYEEGLTIKSPPVGWGDEGEQRIRRSFDQIDGAVDSTSIEDASKGQPDGGPAVLG